MYGKLICSHLTKLCGNVKKLVTEMKDHDNTFQNNNTDLKVIDVFVWSAIQKWKLKTFRTQLKVF